MSAAGFNTASLHVDIMFGSDRLRVSGANARGKTWEIMREGRFVLE
jgi:leucyl aminopeptidase (aminopeptidase T)